MKKLFKLSVRLLAVLMLAFAMFSMTACEDIKKLNLSIDLYDYNNGKMYSNSKVDFSIDLYRHLAPQTVDAIVNLVRNGYYDNTFFYTDSDVESQMLYVGDLKFDENGKIVQNLVDGKLPSQIYGEFASNGVAGSDIKCEAGTVGLLRSRYSNDGSDYKTSSTSRNSGRATIFFPQDSYSSYDGYFCMFGRYDYKNENATLFSSEVYNLLLSSSSKTTYYIFYTGEYDATKPDENHGLTFNCLTKDEYSNLSQEELDNIFSPTGEQLVCYKTKQIYVSNQVEINGVKKMGAGISKATIS